MGLQDAEFYHIKRQLETPIHVHSGLQERGSLFIGAGVPGYTGMIIGEHGKDNDLVVNVCRTKKLTNMRAAGSDDIIRLTPPRLFSLEQAQVINSGGSSFPQPFGSRFAGSTFPHSHF